MSSTLNSTQQYAIDVLNSGRNVFLTGGAGVGKTYTVKEFINTTRVKGSNIMVTAPTGIASIGLDGVTLSRAFEIPLGALTYRIKNYQPNDELVYTAIVIIDEISMCRVDTFDFIANKILQADEIRRVQGLRPIQLVVVGDFFQLPPVITGRDKGALDKYYGTDVGLGYAFLSKFWKFFNFHNIMLTEVIRQSNESFIHDLNQIRVGNKAYIEQIKQSSNSTRIDGAIEICSKNSEVSDINTQELNKIQSQSFLYKAVITGVASETDVIADENLVLKVGARVMTLVNKEEFSNGSLGYIKALYADAIVVVLDNGVECVVTPFVWDVYDYKLEKDDEGNDILVKYVCGTFEQFPLKLAYAITIHKSQGQTYESVNISPYCWECGQLYVAISRAKSVDKIHFNYAPTSYYVCVSLNVIKFYNSLSFDKIEVKQERSDDTRFGADENEIISLLRNL